MIQGFRHKGLKLFFEKDDPSKLQPHHFEKIRRILYRLDEAETIDDMNVVVHMKRGMRPPHPGSMIRDMIEGIKEETGQDLTIKKIAIGLGVTPKTLSNIINEHQGISSEMAIRLSEAFGSKPDFWLKLQRDYELWHAEKKVNRAIIQHFLPLPQMLTSAFLP